MRARILWRLVMSAAMTGAMNIAALAVQPDEILPDAVMEHRARGISGGLRCLVCQNQSIDDSDAPLAKDLRLLVRERLTAGDSDAAAVAFIVSRYGDFVLLKPPFRASTLLLWLSPLLLLAGGAWYGLRAMKASGSRADGVVPLTDDERIKLDQILG